jgi:hypothetical protein
VTEGRPAGFPDKGRPPALLLPQGFRPSGEEGAGLQKAHDGGGAVLLRDRVASPPSPSLPKAPPTTFPWFARPLRLPATASPLPPPKARAPAPFFALGQKRTIMKQQRPPLTTPQKPASREPWPSWLETGAPTLPLKAVRPAPPPCFAPGSLERPPWPSLRAFLISGWPIHIISQLAQLTGPLYPKGATPPRDSPPEVSPPADGLRRPIGRTGLGQKRPAGGGEPPLALGPRSDRRY